MRGVTSCFIIKILKLLYLQDQSYTWLNIWEIFCDSNFCDFILSTKFEQPQKIPEIQNA